MTKQMIKEQFIINEYITLKLEGNQTIIYLNGERFDQCKYLTFQIDLDQTEEYDDIQSIDDMEKRDRLGGFKKLAISPEEEFWGHCSNIQTWFENEYDTRLLHRNLAFPLLKKLYEIGDPTAKNAFKKEIIYRLEEGNETVIQYLLNEGYFYYFSNEEIEVLLNLIKSPKKKLYVFAIKNNAPSEFFELINIIQIQGNMHKKITFGKWILLNNAPKEFYHYFEKLTENVELAKWALLNDAPKAFYEYFEKYQENVELVKWGVQNKAPYEFFQFFENVQKDIELAKWAVTKKFKNHYFYKNIHKVQDNVEIAKWGLENFAFRGFFDNIDKLNRNFEFAQWCIKYGAPFYFYDYFDVVQENMELAKWSIQNLASENFYKRFSMINENPLRINEFSFSDYVKKKFLEKFYETKDD